MATETQLGQGSLAFVKQVFSLPPVLAGRAGWGGGCPVSGLQLELRTHCDEHSHAVPGKLLFRSLISVALEPWGNQMPGSFLSTEFCL